MKKIVLGLLVAVIAFAAIVLVATRPTAVSAARFEGVDGDVAAGEAVFYASGCASCHKTVGEEDPLTLGGGRRLASPFGTFVAPNISPDPEHGLGAWTLADFATSMLKGASTDGHHLYPAFPYTSYTRMDDGDVADLWAFMKTLPSVDRPNEPHELDFPFNLRIALGPWKALFVTDDWVTSAEDEAIERGRYLAEALGHCAECHTPRNAIGALDPDRWMAGAPNPSGKGKIPGLTPDQLSWSADDIAYYLESGLTPDFDSAGGEMAEVIKNTSKLTEEDRAALAAYIKALPAAK